MPLEWGNYLQPIERELRATLASPHQRLDPFYGMMRYHHGFTDEALVDMAGGAGKRLRALLCVLSCKAVGGTLEIALPAAVAVELAHSFSLVHDDIEDQSEYRRHRVTVWKHWGLAHGVNVGDALFSLSRLSLARLADCGANPTRVARAYYALDTACMSLCEGQYLDLRFESERRVGLDDYLWMIRGKTAALMACACELGAIAATDDASTITALHRFGYNLGMAFQIEDDRLGVWGDASATGKPVADDIRSRKKVLPVVWLWSALDVGGASDLQVTADRALDRVYSGETTAPEAIAAAVESLRSAGGLCYCNQLAAEYTRIASDALSSVPGLDADAVQCLTDLAASLVSRPN